MSNLKPYPFRSNIAVNDEISGWIFEIFRHPYVFAFERLATRNRSLFLRKKPLKYLYLYIIFKVTSK